MKKAKKLALEWLDILIIFLPIGWVLACYDGAIELFAAGDYIRFLGHVLCASFISMLLVGFGMLLCDKNIEPDPEPHYKPAKTLALAIELGVLFVITNYIV